MGEFGCGVGEGGVGEAVAEAEEGCLLLGVVPLVAYEEAFGVVGVEGGQGGALGAGAGGDVGVLLLELEEEVHAGEVGVGEVLHGFGEGDGEFSGGVDGSGEDLGDGWAALDSGEPGFEDCVYVVDPGHEDGAAGLEDDDGVFVSGCYSGDEVVLVVGEA